ncbi:MAG: insulinase family protein [Chthoniobacterales bacterium]|nr:insulinase family protein [Chthoniobacterales bacterium]
MKNKKKEMILPGSPQLFTLPNGATLLVEEDHHAPVASVQAWCSTGSIHEGAHLGSGLSHILEHMIFKGTTHRPPGAIAQEVQEQGGYINAYTSFDRTVFWIDVPSTGATKALDILADAMLNANFPAAEYEKEQEVIRREFAMMEDDPDRKSTELLFKTAFQVSPLRHPVIGYLDVFNQLTRQDVVDYYKKRYVPNNLCFVVVGDVNVQKIHDQLTEALKNYPRQSLEPLLVEQEPSQIGIRLAREPFATELSRLNIAWRAPGLTSPDAPAVEILATILGGGSSSLLNQEVHEKKALVHQIGAGLYTLNACEGMIYLGAVADPEKRDEAEAAIFQEVEKVVQHGVTVAELEKAKKGILSDHLNGLATMRGKASDYGSSWLGTGNPNFGKEYLASIDRVTLQDIHRVATKYLVRDGLTMTSLDPKPSFSVKNQKESVSKTKQRDVQSFVLPNGLRLLIGEDHRLPLISMIAMFRGGLLAEDSYNNGLADLLSSTIIKGTKKRTAENIAQTIEQVGGSIGAAAGNNSFSVSVDVMKPDFSLGLDLLAEVLTEATFPDLEVQREKLSQLAAIKAEEDQLLSKGRHLLYQKLFGSHPYAMRLLGTTETVPKLTPAMLQALYQQGAVGQNGVLAIFGDVKAQEVVEAAKKAFQKMPPGALMLQNPSAPEPLTKPLCEEIAEKKEQAIVLKGFLTTSVTSPDRTALEILNAACNDLGSRFFNRLREQEALAYYVGSSNFVGLAPGAFLFYLGTNPQKISKARALFEAEIGNVAEHGLTQEELDRAKKKIIGADAIATQSNGSFASYCASSELMGLGFDQYRRHQEEIQKVTLDQLNTVIKKYLNVSGSAEVVVTSSIVE